MNDLQALLDRLSLLYESGNEIPVDRAVIMAEDFKKLKSAVEELIESREWDLDYDR